MGKGVLLWLIGVPTPVILVLFLIVHHWVRRVTSRPAATYNPSHSDVRFVRVATIFRSMFKRMTSRSAEA